MHINTCNINNLLHQGQINLISQCGFNTVILFVYGPVYLSSCWIPNVSFVRLSSNLVWFIKRTWDKVHTVVLRTNETIAVYRSKMAFFNRTWQKVKVLSRPWALGFKSEMIRPLKWGTLGSRTPSGSKNTSRQSWKKKIKLWRLVFLEPSGVREPNVPHFKGLIVSDLNPRAQRRDITFTFCHALLKKAILLL